MVACCPKPPNTGLIVWVVEQVRILAFFITDKGFGWGLLQYSYG